jgi:hypothetical protein
MLGWIGNKGLAMRGGIWVLTIFAAIWGILGVTNTGLPSALALVPIGISIALLFWATRQVPAPIEDAAQARIGRLVGIWSAVEGLAIVAAVIICQNIGAAHAIVPVIAIIVGLHFLPLARGIPVPFYYATGAAMIVTGGGALLLTGPARIATTGLGAAIILWISCVALVLGHGSTMSGAQPDI